MDVPPAPDVPVGDPRLVERGWVDLRASNWARWAKRMAAFEAELAARPGGEEGSVGDHEFGDDTPEIRPGRLAAWIFRYEDQGERIKR